MISFVVNTLGMVVSAVNELMLIDERNVLGKDFKMYGSVQNPLFLAKDVANWIEHTNPTVMLKTVDEDEKLVIVTPTKQCLEGMQPNTEYTFLTEEGLYEVLMLSRKPIAKQFKKEVKHILKQIRQTGGYVQQGRENEMVDYYFNSFSDDIKLAMVKELQQRNAQLQEFYDDLMNTEELLDMNTVAKELEIGEYALFAYLRGKKIFFYNKDKVNIPYERFRREGKFKVKETPCHDGKMRNVTYATRKGLDYIRKIMRKDGLLKIA